MVRPAALQGAEPVRTITASSVGITVMEVVRYLDWDPDSWVEDDLLKRYMALDCVFFSLLLSNFMDETSSEFVRFYEAVTEQQSS